MSNQGIRGFYQLTETIKTQLLSDINCKTVTIGNLTDVNLQKQDIFPLAHMIVNNVSQEDGVLIFSISILNMDIVDRSKSETTDIFIGNNNEQDILNTQLSVINKLVQVLRGGDLHQNGYQLQGSVSIEPFYDRFENELAGWESLLNVEIYNDINIC
jgi:hypothetical protein|tara:strand:- start:1781 stop:2251 length:471 start_codon:yes stop_codon:yes gene_type:complete